MSYEYTTVYRLFPFLCEQRRFSGQDRLSTALWFISGAEISIRLDKDLKFVDDDSLIWVFSIFYMNFVAISGIWVFHSSLPRTGCYSQERAAKMLGFELYGNGKK